MKVSHFEKYKVDDMIKWLRLKYEHLFEDGSGAMQVRRGKVHEYIGITLDFTEPGECSMPMLQDVKDLVNNFTEYSEDDKTAITPAAEHLFKIDKGALKLDEETSKVFHNFVARSLYLTIKRARPDIHTAVAFLTTRSENQTRMTGRSYNA
jgi:hypothetical protein